MMFWILCTLAHFISRAKASQCTLPAVEDICVHGNDKAFIADGAPFEFFAYNAITKTNVYFCEECWGSGVSSAYLYGCISSITDRYYWLIGPDYHSCSAWSRCYVGNALGPNYNFDINDCLGAATDNWLTYDGSTWNEDNDMSLSMCNPICYESEVYPQTNTKTSKSVDSKVDVSTAWNGDLYFDFTIVGQDCMYPKLSFEYELIDHDATFENIEIFDDNDMIIATCNGGPIGQMCGFFDSCITDYYIDDVIQMNGTYSITIHQTADVDNLCGDNIFNAVLTLTCNPSDNNNNNNIATTKSSTKSISSTKSSTKYPTKSSNEAAETEGGKTPWIYTAGGIIIMIVVIVGYCWWKILKTGARGDLPWWAKLCCWCMLWLLLKKTEDKDVKEKQSYVVVVMQPQS